MKVHVMRNGKELEVFYLDINQVQENEKNISSKTIERTCWIGKLQYFLGRKRLEDIDYHPLIGYSFETKTVYVFRLDAIIKETKDTGAVFYVLSHFFHYDIPENIEIKRKALGVDCFCKEWLLLNLEENEMSLPPWNLKIDFYDRRTETIITTNKLEPRCISKDEIIQISEELLVGKYIYLIKNDNEIKIVCTLKMFYEGMNRAFHRSQTDPKACRT